MKLLFVSLLQRLSISIGLGYVVTYIKKAGYNITVIDIDAHQHSDEDVENYLKENNLM